MPQELIAVQAAYWKPWVVSLLAAALCGALLLGCGDDSTAPIDSGPGTDAGPDLDNVEYPQAGVLARFDLAQAMEDAFFAFPYPSDLRLNENGGPDLGAFPTEFGASILIEGAVNAAEQTVRGFANVAISYFSFEGELDPATLPADPEASMADDATAYVIDITPESPWYGIRHPVIAHYRADPGRYWAASTVALQPLYGLPLRNDTTYAAVITTGVMGTNGLPAIGPPAFRGIFDGTASAEIASLYEPFVEALDTVGIHPNTIAVATVFTTGNPAMELVRLREWMHATLPEPVAEDLFLAYDGHLYDIYEGTFPSEEFMDGVAPYRRFGEGTLTIGEDGEPATRVPIDLRFAITIPAGEPPPDGWPIVLFSHGTGGDYDGFTSSRGAEMARRGVAMMGINQPLHGDRNPTNEDPLDLIVSLTISNIVVGRDMLRQHVADLFQTTRLVRSGFEIPASVSATGRAIRIDPERIAFMGHSQGAQVGALFLPLEPDIEAGVYSEAGGASAISLMERKENDIDIAAIVSTALGLSGSDEVLTDYHPTVGVVIQPMLAPADPLEYARYTFLEPLDGVAHSLLMTEGLQDAATPPPGIEALASASGLPIAEPVYAEVLSMRLQGIGTVVLPATENLPAFGEQHPTGALIQFAGRNHYLTSTDHGARYQVYEFLRTALDGQPYIYPAEDK